MFGIVGIIHKKRNGPKDIKRPYEGLISPLLKDKRTIRNLIMDESCIVSTVESELESVRTTICEQFGDGISVTIFGEIYNDLQAGESPTEYVHRLFVKDGVTSLAGLNGSFCLFIYDQRQAEGFLVADRFATRPVLYYISENYVIFSPDQRSFVDSGCVPRKANPAAVAAMLSSGHLYNDDTYIQDVKYLRGGLALRTKPAETQIIKYRDYAIEPQADEGLQAYKQRLSPLLIQAIVRRLKNQPKPALFLSGGLDSRAILGACMELGLKIELCSYYSRNDRQSDACVAEKLARLSGMPFRLISYDQSDILEAVRRTTPYFGGMRSSIYEYDALAQIRGDYSSILIGDESFGWYDYALANEEDMFASANIFHLSNSPTAKLISAEYYKRLQPQDEAAFNRLSYRTELVDIYARRVYFGTTECVGRDIVPGRCFLNYAVAKVRQPWLDNDILDFMRLLPIQYSHSKVLFDATVRTMFPHLFSVPKATNQGSFHESARYYSLILKKNPDIVSQVCFKDKYPIDSIFERAALENYFYKPAYSLGGKLREYVKTSNFMPLRKLSKIVYDQAKRRSAVLAKKMQASHLCNLSQHQILERIAILRLITGDYLKLDID
jgi:asparagine synthetase B (glutamine-hydrolysing)